MARRASSAPACAVAWRDIRRRRAAAPAPPHAKRTKRVRIRAARGALRPGRPTGRGPAATAEQQRTCVARLASPTPEHSRRATRSRFSSKRKGMVGARRSPADQLSPRQNRLQHSAARFFARASAAARRPSAPPTSNAPFPPSFRCLRRRSSHAPLAPCLGSLGLACPPCATPRHPARGCADAGVDAQQPRRSTRNSCSAASQRGMQGARCHNALGGHATGGVGGRGRARE